LRAFEILLFTLPELDKVELSSTVVGRSERGDG